MNLRSYLSPEKCSYVLVTVLVSGVGFARSFAFMKGLDMEELGLISLMQTVILFLGLLQFGLLNGGYRIFALDKKKQQEDINNLLFSYLAIMSGVLLTIWVVFYMLDFSLVMSNVLLLLSIVCGIFTLLMTWLTNTLIGKQLIVEINKINLFTAFISLLALPLAFVWDIRGAIIVQFTQPFVFVAVTLYRNPELRPTRWFFDLGLIRYILHFGFIPFCAGIFVIVNLQIERWSIVKILGTEALGQFYLVFLYATLFVLIPASLLNIFFPPVIRAYEQADFVRFNSLMKQYVALLAVYVAAVVLFTVFLLAFFIEWIFPAHIANVIYVYYFLPGLIALVLCDPFSLVFNATVRLRPMLIGGIISIGINIVLVLIFNHYRDFTLINMSIIKSIINIIVLVYYGVYVFIYRKPIFPVKFMRRQEEICLEEK